MSNGGEEQGDEPNLSTVGSGRVDTLFDEIELSVEMLDRFADELESVRKRIEANDGETSGHVRNRINQDADQLAEEAEETSEKLRERLRELKRSV
ncbi:hypothetical protein [Halorussus halophilus]|uniref:hypothetical protein n=1 Tax=Halorussus halophilus TaxID=2650975 RepID=UPI001300F54C|nr:hypothetical protein [Halorussus halophilus]